MSNPQQTEFKIQSITLFSDRYQDAGLPGLDLSRAFAGIDIYESLDKPYLTADVILNDDTNWFESYDILGGENVEITIISMRDGGAVSTQAIQKLFYVHYVSVQQRVNEYQQIVMLHLIEDVAYISNLQNVNKFYKGKGNEIIEKICNEFLDKKLNVTNPTKDNQLYNLIVPNLDPLQTINWITSSLTTDNGFPFYVFSTFAKKDLYLRDLESLMQDEPINPDYSYRWSPARISQPDASIARRVIATMKVGKSEDLFNLIKEGYIGSKYSYLNLAAPDAETESQFDYDIVKDTLKPALETTNIFPVDQKNPAYSPNFKYDGTPFNEMKSRHISILGGSHAFRLTNLPTDGSKPQFPLAIGEAYDIADYKLFVSSQAIDNLLKKTPITIAINGIDFIDGNDHYTIGNRINCEFAKTNDRATEDSKTSKLDTKLSGNYLIYRARHIIKPEKYDLSLTMVKLGSKAGS